MVLMGVSLVLIPLALAVTGAVATREELGSQVRGITLKTRMKRWDLLERALREYGSQYVAEEKGIRVFLDGGEIKFVKNREGEIEAQVSKGQLLRSVTSFLEVIHEEYTKVLQEEVYKKLVSRAEQYGFVFESEEVQEDHSIVLTLAIREGSR
jgi:hypothetical protein